MQSAFEYGDKIKLSTGEIGIFEEYNEADRKKCYVILDLDSNALGSQSVNISDIERR